MESQLEHMQDRKLELEFKIHDLDEEMDNKKIHLYKWHVNELSGRINKLHTDLSNMQHKAADV